MTENYDPYVNVIDERVNRVLKEEILLEDYQVDLATMKLLFKEAVTVYDTKRSHWSCYMNRPEQMHRQKEIKIRTYKKQIVIGLAR